MTEDDLIAAEHSASPECSACGWVTIWCGRGWKCADWACGIEWRPDDAFYAPPASSPLPVHDCDVCAVTTARTYPGPDGRVQTETWCALCSRMLGRGVRLHTEVVAA